MTTKDDFILIPFALELEEVPAPGTSPEAPDGPAYIAPDEEDGENDDEDDIGLWVDDDGNADGFKPPPKKGEDLL